MTPKLVALTLLSLAAAACGRQLPPQASAAKSVFGAMDLRLLMAGEIAADPLAQVMGAVMVVVADPQQPGVTYAFPSCSGVQIGRRLVLTAGHCDRAGLIFNQSRIAADGDRDRWAMQRFGSSFRANFTGEMIPAAQSGERVPPVAGAVYHSAVLDVAVLQFPYDLGPSYIALGKPPELLQGATAARIYAYPNGLPLTRADHCVADGDDDPRYLRHDCDSLTGSSGGLISSAEGRPLAIQLAGPGENRPDYYDEHGAYEDVAAFALRRGCRADHQGRGEGSPPCLAALGLNKALRFSAIAADIQDHAPAALAAAVLDGQGG